MEDGRNGDKKIRVFSLWLNKKGGKNARQKNKHDSSRVAVDDGARRIWTDTKRATTTRKLYRWENAYNGQLS